MRSSIPRWLVLGLGLTTALALNVGLLGAQEQPTPAPVGEGIFVTPGPDGNPATGTQLHPYDVIFAPGAFIPQQEYPEAMVVWVAKGAFAFRVKSDVLVDTRGKDLKILTRTPPIGLETPPSETPDHAYAFQWDGSSVVPDCGTSASSPKPLCLINPKILGDNFVELDQDYTVYLPDHTTCFFCNTTGLLGVPPATSTAGTPEAGEEGELLVWAPFPGFSWYPPMGLAAASPSPASTPPAGSVTPSARGLTATEGWMVEGAQLRALLNPGSRCN